MRRARYFISVLGLGATAAFTPMRKEGIRATVQSIAGDSVRIDITGTVMLTEGLVRGMHQFPVGRPFHATTPFTFFPSLAAGPVEIRTVQGKHIKVVVDNLVTGGQLEGVGRIIEVSRPDTTKPVQLSAKP